MKTVSVAKVKARLDAYLTDSTAEPIVVTKDGKAIAVLVGIQDDDELERMLFARSKKLQTILDSANRRIDEGGGINHDDFWAKVESQSSAKEPKPATKRRSTRK